MLNFISSNYMIMLIVVMIFIFALIGRYLDKLGFFISYKPKDEKKDITPTIEENTLEEEPEESVAPVDPNSINDIDSALFASIDKDPEYEKLRREVNNILSKKDVIDDDLLSDIEHLSLDKTQRYNFGDIPDLDDVDLPKIKKSEEPKDIWKF